MKFYESTFEEYLHSYNKFNIHPELNKIVKSFQARFQRRADKKELAAKEDIAIVAQRLNKKHFIYKKEN